MLSFPFLSSRGVLGLNARNLLYIKPFNPKKAVALADDKLKTKAYLAARGIPVARIYARIETRKQLSTFNFDSLPDHFALKPNFGFGGEGILIIKGRTKDGRFLRQGKHPMSNREMIEHIEDILEGRFSINGMPDTAFFERLLVSHECFTPFRPAGLPDLRIVVFNLVPVMAMLRVPTAQSGGKANVHLGGVGIGIDVAKGITTHATQFNNIVPLLPHGASPSGFEIPFWDEILLIASRIQYYTNIGYLAVDLTIDAEQGPVLLEVNARAGLMVQVANLAPLRTRLERIEGAPVSSPEKGVRMAQDLFGEKVHAKQSNSVPAKPVLSLRETIHVAGDGLTIEVPVAIALDYERTTFSPELVSELVEKGALERTETDEDTYRAKFTLEGKKIQTLIQSGDVAIPGVRAVIGQRELSGFLIDPSKKKEASLVRSKVKENLQAIDRLLAQIDREFLLLKLIKPVNLEDERRILEQDASYSPMFQYPEISGDIDDAERRLQNLAIDDSPMGQLLSKKRDSLLERFALIRARGDSEAFTQASKELFGEPTDDLLADARSYLATQIACDLPVPPDEMIEAKKAAALFTQTLEGYGLHDWDVKIRDTLVADCTVGAQSVYVRSGAKFSKEHLHALIAHEIETHVLTSENGAGQPFELFRRGFGHYLDTQEGLAIYNQNRILSANHERRFSPAKGVLALEFALSHSFAETRAFLFEELGYTKEKALTNTMQMKRGLQDTALPGAFTKTLVYFRGWRSIELFVSGGGDLHRLYIGKITLDDLALAERVPGLKPPVLLPLFLRNEKK